MLKFESAKYMERFPRLVRPTARKFAAVRNRLGEQFKNPLKTLLKWK